MRGVAQPIKILCFRFIYLYENCYKWFIVKLFKNDIFINSCRVKFDFKAVSLVSALFFGTKTVIIDLLSNYVRDTFFYQ